MIREEIDLLIKYVDSLESSKLHHVSGYERSNTFFLVQIAGTNITFGYPYGIPFFNSASVYVVDANHNSVEVNLSFKESRALYKCYSRTLKRSKQAKLNEEYIRTQELLRSAVKPLVIAKFNDKADGIINED